MTTILDPLALAQALIRCPSVTPTDAGALDLVTKTLTSLGFRCRRLRFGAVDNLYARWGEGRPHLCFAGHTDVVPPGDVQAWRHDPFAGALESGQLFGRGAVDMKSAMAAFIAAAAETLATRPPVGSISLLITGDEEGQALDGTRRMVDLLASEGEVVDHCLVGEPTSAERLGDMMKIGRRGSLNAAITVTGVQGHVAYPHRAANPVRPLITLLAQLQARRLDSGFEGFQPSNLEITSIDVGNTATNVIPGSAEARLNIRFNPAHRGADLVAWLSESCAEAERDFAGKVSLDARVSGEAFLTAPGAFTALVANAAADITGIQPELSTTGGTSDARFIRALCPVVELGLVGATMHAVDERVPVDDVLALTAIYQRVVARYFAASW